MITLLLLAPLVAFLTFVLLGLTIAVALAMTVALIMFIAGLYLGSKFTRTGGTQYNQVKKKTTLIVGRNVVCTLSESESSTTPNQIDAIMDRALYGCQYEDQAYAIAERLNSQPRWLERKAGEKIEAELGAKKLQLPKRGDRKPEVITNANIRHQ